MNPDNACILRITAAAGTELADAYSYGTVSSEHVRRFLPIQKKFTTHRAVILHAAWLVGLASIAQYSLLLPPVGVWSVSQYQCGGSSSQTPYASKPW